MNKFLIALLGGITLGFLFAPAKGSETRKYLKDSFDDLKDSLVSEIKELKAETEALASDPELAYDEAYSHA